MPKIKDKTNVHLVLESLANADKRKKLWNSDYVQDMTGLPKEYFNLKNITEFYGN